MGKYSNKNGRGTNVNKYRKVYKKAWKWAGGGIFNKLGNLIGVPAGGAKGYKLGGQLYKYIWPRDNHRYQFASNRLANNLRAFKKPTGSIGKRPPTGGNGRYPDPVPGGGKSRTGQNGKRITGRNGRVKRTRGGKWLTSQKFRGKAGRWAHRL